MPSSFAGRAGCRGFLMIEVLVTMIILAVGLLGAAALQAKSVQYAYASSQRTLATIQANDLVERLWASACKLPADLAVIEGLWQDEWENDARFPEWDGAVIKTDSSSNNNPVYDITITWTDSRVDSAGEQVFAYTTSVPRLGCN